MKVPEQQDLEDLRIELPAAGDVRGTVVDTRGRAVARSTVSLRGGSRDFSAIVADDGSFKVEHVGIGMYQAFASRREGDLQFASGDNKDHSGEPVEVEAGKVTVVNLVVAEATGTISGFVQDADGGRIDDAFVEAIPASDEEGESGPARRGAPWGDFSGTPILTEVDGRFILTGLLPGKYTLRAFRKGGGEGFVKNVESGMSVTLTIPATGRLAGSVYLPGGAIAEEFSIQVVDSATGFSRKDTFFRTGGEWSVPELPAGSYKIRVNMGNATADGEALVKAGEDTTGLRIEVTPKVSVRGSVVDATGGPVAGLRIIIRSVGGASSAELDAARRHVTDSDGRFELANVPTGLVEVIVVAQNPKGDGAFESVKIPMEISASTTTIDLAPIKLSNGT